MLNTMWIDLSFAEGFRVIVVRAQPSYGNTGESAAYCLVNRGNGREHRARGRDVIPRRTGVLESWRMLLSPHFPEMAGIDQYCSGHTAFPCNVP